MEISKNQLDKLYKTYGFEINNEHISLGIYLYKKGRYFGVDIIPLNCEESSNELAEKEKEKYSELGFAASIKVYKNIKDAHSELFKSFFSYESTIIRLNRKYTDFKTKQTKNLLGNKYEYIDTPYEEFSNPNSEKKIIAEIQTLVNDNSPRLIIVEAAAGYGKTCTAYELLNIITNKKDKIKVPIFTELGRNRGAKIFRYILLDEIDLEYSSLSSDLVISEIKNGKIPLIIDGFDELLDKVNLDKDIASAFEEVESMLDTIGKLLEGKAKIILTTRKTAIFGGIEFEKWIEKWGNSFETNRFTLKDPRIKDWLGYEKYLIIKNKDFPIQYISNPVILTYLKNLSNQEFQIQIESPELLVQDYFNKMLEREKERQNLIITVEKQYEIFKNVVKLLLELDITSESKEFFKDIIKDQNTKLLEYTRSLYSGTNKPTLENLVDSLATHALLDRKGRDENQIGFINDFILGTFVGEIIIESPIDKIEKEYSYYMIELASTAYKVQSEKNKNALWEQLDKIKGKFQALSLFNFDITLKGKLTREYDNLSIIEREFFSINFDAYKISSTVFLNCSFKKCFFNSEFLRGISFINCKFENCSIKNEEFLDLSNEISAINPIQSGSKIFQFTNQSYLGDNQNEYSPMEIRIFKILLQTSNSKSPHFIKLQIQFEKSEAKELSKAVSNLLNRGYLIFNGNYINYNINKLPQIKNALKIENGKY